MGTKFILGQEDGTVAGGNARGEGAVDLQMSRTNSNQVAGGQYDVIVGGRENLSTTNPNGYSFIGGGQNNRILYGGHSVIVGGLGNTVNQPFGTGASAYHTIGGGSTNTTSSQYSTISGGQSNTASTSTYATVVGGLQNTSSGQYSVSGGYVNVASGMGGVALGGGANAIGTYSLATGGSTFAKGTFSQSFGNWSEAYLYGQTATQAGRFNGQSDAQISSLIARIEAALTTGGTTVLSLDGTGTTNLIIPTGTNRMWNVTIKYVAVVTTITGTATGVTVGDTKSQNIEIGFKKVGGVSSLVGGGSFSIPQEDASMSSASLIPTAGGSQELALTFTAPTFAGGGSVTCRVVAKVELVEVAY